MIFMMIKKNNIYIYIPAIFHYLYLRMIILLEISGIRGAKIIMEPLHLQEVILSIFMGDGDAIYNIIYSALSRYSVPPNLIYFGPSSFAKL